VHGSLPTSVYYQLPPSTYNLLPHDLPHIAASSIQSVRAMIALQKVRIASPKFGSEG
jgi:hypothetical protein